MVPTAISSATTGAIRIAGTLETTGLTIGSDYYVSGTPGVLTLTPQPYARIVGRAQSATVLIVDPNPRPTPTVPTTPCGRLTLTTGVAVTTADVTAAGTLFYTPYGGCSTVTTFDGAIWSERSFTQISIAVPAVATQMYDVFAFDNAGTLTLELTAWTSDTLRATALTTQNGVYAKTGALTRLYLGSVRTVTASQLNDSYALRHVWNYYHRVPRPMRVIEATNTWPYSTAAFQQARATATNQLDFVVGVAEVSAHVFVTGQASNDTNPSRPVVSIGFDSVTVPVPGVLMSQTTSAVTTFSASTAVLDHFPTVGRHVYVWLEYDASGAGITTWAGDGGVTFIQSGIIGVIDG